jgi:hypothetical protein
MTVPDYRLRLFMAVDLVGSTAFKSSEVNQHYDKLRATPKWVAVFRDFYDEFVNMMTKEYDRRNAEANNPNERDLRPSLWKTIGDELVLCCTVKSVDQVVICIESFLSCLKRYSELLEAQKYGLDVKGNAWLAAFPAPNVTIPFDGRSSEEDFDTSETIELAADQAPHQFDFLGKSIDTGFRVAGSSSYDRCSLSVQLGYVLAEASVRKAFAGNVEFSGRTALKGVNEGTPYPRLFIDTERSHKKITLRGRENLLTGQSMPTQQQVLDFLNGFMDLAEIERPVLSYRNGDTQFSQEAASYRMFKENYELAQTEAVNRDATMSADVPEGHDENVGEIPEAMADELMKINGDT